MIKKNITTWLDYIANLDYKNADPQLLNIEGAENYLLINQQFNAFFYHSIPMVYLLDYTTGKYITMSKSTEAILGYSSKEFMEGGINFTIERYLKDDLKLFNEKIFPDRLQILKSIPVIEQPQHIFSYNFRIRNSKGEAVNLLQRNCFIKSDDSGQPLASFGMVINISHYKKESPVIQTVEKLNNGSIGLPVETIHKKSYYLHDEDQLFTKREKEVLLWTADGLSSKAIAEKMSISENTVTNHRKNMLLKSGSRNLVQLIAFALMNSII